VTVRVGELVPEEVTVVEMVKLEETDAVVEGAGSRVMEVVRV